MHSVGGNVKLDSKIFPRLPIGPARGYETEPFGSPPRSTRPGLLQSPPMGLLTFALNVTLDGGNDHREMIADNDMLD
jgi:hypothetical protein